MGLSISLRTLAHQARWHIAVRLVSSVCSFLLFSLIANKLADEQAQRAFFFLLSLGFGLAVLRLFAQLAAGMEGQVRSTVRLRQACQGLARVVRVLPFTVPLLAAILWAHTASLFIVTIACLVACLVAVDIDLPRAVVHRGPAFSSAFAIGSMLAMIGLALHPNPNFEAVCFWIVVQWIPVGVLNIAALRYLLGCRFRLAKNSHSADPASLLLLAVFDGVVLNAPFLGGFTPLPSTGVDLSLSVRLFVASLVMQPMLLHWANSEALANLAMRMRVGIAMCFSMLLLISGVVAGAAFMLLYILVSGKQASVTAFVVYLLLLVSYSLYASQMRLSNFMHGHHRLWLLVVLLLAYAAVFGLYAQSLRESALNIGLLQSFVLFACALALNFMSKWKAVR